MLLFFVCRKERKERIEHMHYVTCFAVFAFFAAKTLRRIKDGRKELCLS